MASFEWGVPLLVAVIVIAILYLTGPATRRATRGPGGPTSGAELIDRLQKTLGMAIVVDSIEPAEPLDSGVTVRSAEPTTIRATLMFGRYTTQVVAAGPTESDAWSELARMAIAWRNSDYQHIQMWPGGG